MRNQSVELIFGFSPACIRAMLARSRSSAGSSGAVCPAAICASLRRGWRQLIPERAYRGDG
jgi:hypothetical protein